MSRCRSFFLIVVLVFVPLMSEARFRHEFVRHFPVEGWRTGYWFHGTYLDRAGWWWVVGPNWYYYSNPQYPYPSAEAEPVYVVQAANFPPPSLPMSSGAPVAPSTMTAKPRAFSYYCEKSKSYYPIVNACADGWVATSVAPPN